MSESFRGVFTIPSTPFDEQLEVDWEGLRRIVDFCVECGAHGIVWPVNASGFATLSDEERLKGARAVVEQVAGRIPVVIGTQGVSTTHAMMFSRHAKEIGADAVIAMAPYIRKLDDEELLLQYYRGISDATDLPIFIQNHAVGSVLSVDTMVRLLREVEHVEYIKEETMPAIHKLTQVLERAPRNKLKGVFGGSGGRYLLLEHPRGVAGQMPGCHITDVVVRLWNALEAGDLKEAKRVYGLMAPLFALEEQRVAGYSEVLRIRGIIKSGRQRGGVSIMDKHDHQALDDILRDLEPLFTWHGPGAKRS
ncbi:L-2-keto-3-deoxyarabonate dehydratase [subsurface metagenome]